MPLKSARVTAGKTKGKCINNICGTTAGIGFAIDETAGMENRKR